MADASADRRSRGDTAAADLNGTFAAGEGVIGASLALTPAAALARHVEWLDFALGAATAEETWRRERLAKATKGNRARRTDRLAEVVAEIEELTALLTGIHELERRAASAPAATPRRRGRPPGSKNGTGTRSTSATSAATKAPAKAAAATKSTATQPTAAKAAVPKSTATKASAPKSTATKARAAGRPRTTAVTAPASSGALDAGSAADRSAKPTTSPARRRRSTPTTAG